MEVIEFKPEHLDMMELRDTEKEYLASDARNKDRIVKLSTLSLCGTLAHNGLLLGAFGAIEHAERRFILWAYPSIHVKDYPMIYLRTVKRYLKALETTHNPERVETVAMSDTLHDRWMLFLGFTNETPNGMRKYLPWGTFNQWSKVYGA